MPTKKPTLQPFQAPAIIPLETLRRIAGLTQNELAKEAGVQKSFISLLEAGERSLRQTGSEIVARLAWALHLSVEELLAFTSPRDREVESAPEAPEEPHALVGGQS